MKVLSGIQPSGKLHLGNYFAMMSKMISYQKQEELFCFIVNYHAQTTISDGALLKSNTLNAAMDFLALGLDPEKTVFWIQSDVPEVVELTWYLSNFTPVGLLERSHSYKDKIAKGISPNSGLFIYPVLMAADILLYQGEKIPVGKDQKQHVEITRDIAIKFNNEYGDVFTLPEPEIDTDIATIPGVDGKKMSKSYDNTIEIFAERPQLKKKVMSIVTDASPIEAPKDPDNCVLFQISSLFLEKDERAELAERYRAGGLKYSKVKKELISIIMDYFQPYREKREKLSQDMDTVKDIMAFGADKARKIAMETMEKVRSSVGVNYRS